MMQSMVINDRQITHPGAVAGLFERNDGGGSGAWNFTGITYLTEFALPNFSFHVGMVYALLRKNGVEIGKSDFLGRIQ